MLVDASWTYNGKTVPIYTSMILIEMKNNLILQSLSKITTIIARNKQTISLLLLFNDAIIPSPINHKFGYANIERHMSNEVKDHACHCI
mmetsp:Transcript_28288/g.41537  ORF Transcript_28288/g.41537 Transcript_28288/m.41537 type:complete len:89 (-) Transcript_28288:1624-1890(-)